jgi:sec-independent protein translocase protein TatA
MGAFGIWHWLVVLAIVLILFGSGKISGIMGDFAKGIKAFKKNIKDEETATTTGGGTIEGKATAKEKDPVA